MTLRSLQQCLHPYNVLSWQEKNTTMVKNNIMHDSNARTWDVCCSRKVEQEDMVRESTVLSFQTCNFSQNGRISFFPYNANNIHGNPKRNLRFCYTSDILLYEVVGGIQSLQTRFGRLKTNYPPLIRHWKTQEGITVIKKFVFS